MRFRREIWMMFLLFIFLAAVLGLPLLGVLFTSRPANELTIVLFSYLLFILAGFHFCHFVYVFNVGWKKEYCLTFPFSNEHAVPRSIRRIYKHPKESYKNHFVAGVFTFTIFTAFLSIFMTYAISMDQPSPIMSSSEFSKYSYEIILSTIVILVTAEFGILATLGKEVPLFARNFVLLSLGLDMCSFIILVAMESQGFSNELLNQELILKVATLVLWLVTIVASLNSMYFVKYINDIHRDAIKAILNGISMGPADIEPQP